MADSEVDANDLLANLLEHHGIHAWVEENYLVTDLPQLIACQAMAAFETLDQGIHSTMRLVFCTSGGDSIIEMCSDVGPTLEDALRQNVANFARYALHPLLAALGSVNAHVLEQVMIEEWTIQGARWQAFIGNLAPKMSSDGPAGITPPPEFFATIEAEIHTMSLHKPLHWVSSFYSQVNGVLSEKEFWLDNETTDIIDTVFTNIPILQDVTYFTCRNFIVLRKL